jgi:hypothetical protein
MNGLSAVLWTVALILLVLWILGFAFNAVGGLVHVLLVLIVIAVAVEIFRMATRSRRN